MLSRGSMITVKEGTIVRVTFKRFSNLFGGDIVPLADITVAILHLPYF